MCILVVRTQLSFFEIYLQLNIGHRLLCTPLSSALDSTYPQCNAACTLLKPPQAYTQFPTPNNPKTQSIYIYFGYIPTKQKYVVCILYKYTYETLTVCIGVVGGWSRFFATLWVNIITASIVAGELCQYGWFWLMRRRRRRVDTSWKRWWCVMMWIQQRLRR